MSEIDRKIKEIFSRVDIAASGQNNTDYWSDEENNLSAPNGMDYWDWIEQATNDALLASKELVEQNKALKALLSEASEYLDTNSMTNIGSGSVLHTKFKEALEQAR